MARRSAVEAEATRRDILAAARVRFARDGFVATKVADIAGDINATDGAVFHHFGSKKGLFRAVFEQLERELDEAARSAQKTGTPAQRFIEGCRAYLNYVARDDYSRIAMMEAPSVLGRNDWHEIDAGLGLKTVTRAVEALIKLGVVEDQPAKPLAVLLFGALNQSGFALARKEEGVSVDAMVDVLERLLPRL